MVDPTERRAIVLTVDGWGAGYLGPYGNTWIETTACNQLASSGMLLEHCLVDTPTIEGFFHAMWSGSHAALPPRPAGPSLAQVLGDAQRASCLITDDQRVAEHPSGTGFDRAELVGAARPKVAADTAEQTQLARLMAAALTTLESEPADLIWIHSQGMNAAWDAPREFREQFRDEDDPESPTDVDPPEGRVSEGIDPDIVQGWVWAYAGQVALLDCALEALWSSWQHVREPTLLIVMGARGYALAEHGYWGQQLGSLHSEHLHVPLMIVSNSLELANVRSQQLVQPHHVFQTLLNWLDVDHPRREEGQNLIALPARDLSVAGADWPPLAVARLDDRWALRSPAWHACLDKAPAIASPSAIADLSRSSQALSSCKLYLKPDDRWEVNDVADRCPDVVLRFTELREALSGLRGDQGLETLLPLDVALCSPPE